MDPKSLKERDTILLIEIMRRKAKKLNKPFGCKGWTPRKLDMILAWIGLEMLPYRDEKPVLVCSGVRGEAKS